MPRVKMYEDKTCLEAARERIRLVYDIFDTVAICWSGGKDSTAALWLAREVVEERGLGKVRVVFRDEELIPDQVIDHVNRVLTEPWIEPYYFAVPLRSSKFILGKTYSYVQWGTGRNWVRPRPEHAITLQPGDNRTFDQYTIDGYTAERFRGSVAFVTGIRADESLTRLRSVLNKLNLPFITNTDSSATNVRLAKVIYDWTENDVLKYLQESHAPLCGWYDGQMWAGCQLRVSTPLHAEQAKRLGKLRTIDPEFYDRVLAVFPESATQDRYWAEVDRDALRSKYGDSPEGIQGYIDCYIEDEAQHALASKRLQQSLVYHETSPENYPLIHILNHFISGGYKRAVMAMKAKQ